MIIFTRITRTGGTSFWQGIKHNFAERECWQKGTFAKEQYKSVGGLPNALRLDRKFKIAPKIFMHHLPYGVHKLFSVDLFTYITFLREPIARTVSVIRYAAALRYPKKYEEELERAGYFEHQLFLQGYIRRAPNIELVLKKCIENETCCNVMVKQLSGLEDFGNMRATYAYRAGNLYPINHTNARRYTVKEMRRLLEAAKENLVRDYLFGFQENDVRGHKVLCSRLKLGYKDHGVRYKGYEGESSLKDSVDWSAKTVQALLGKMNEYDIKLYEFARGLL